MPYLPIARVIKAHGLNGEVSVAATEGLPFLLHEGLEVFFAPPPAGTRSGRVVSMRPGPKGILVTFDTVRDRDTSSRLVGTQIMVRADEVEIPDDEEFDVVGVTVSDVERGVLGTIAEVIVTGANDVWVVEGGPFGQVLIPVIDDVVIDVDPMERSATVRLLPGLLPDDEELV